MSSQSVGGAGAFLSAAGSIIQGQNTSDTLKYNADIQERNAQGALISAKLNADKQSLMAGKIIGRSAAGYGASGLSADSGSILAVMSESAANAELDKQNIIYGGQIKAANYMNQAALDRKAANNALNASYFNAIGSLVSGGVGAGLFSGGGKASELSTGDAYTGNEEGYNQVYVGGGDSTMMDATVGEADYSTTG